MRKAMVSMAVGLVLAGTSAWAQATQPGTSDVQNQPGMHSHAGMTARQQGRLLLDKSSDIVGKEVVNTKDEDLGHIKELAVDGHTGQIAYAVLEYDKLFTTPDKLFAVPWQALTARTESDSEEAMKMENIKQFVLDVSKDKLNNAPGFNRDKWPDMASTEFEKSVHGFYGVKPYHHQHMMNKGMEGRTSAESGQGTMNNEERIGAEGRTAIEQSRQILKTSKQLIGQKLTDQTGKEVGTVENLLIDRQHGRIALAIAKFDNFGDRDLAALPWKTIDWNWNADKKEGSLALNVPVDQVRREQLFDSGHWPHFTDRQEVASIYRTFNVRPYWEQGGTVFGFQE